MLLLLTVGCNLLSLELVQKYASIWLTEEATFDVY